MRLALGNAWVKVFTYYGSAAMLQLFALAIMYILYKKRADRNKNERFMVTYAVIFLLVYFFPVSSYIISDKMVGRDVYWRMFWLLPVELVIAYVFSMILTKVEAFHKKAILFVIGTTVVIGLGGNVYKQDAFSDRQNWHKLDAEALEVCSVIEADALATGNRTEAVVKAELYDEIRIYDANIKMPYGRNASRSEGMGSEKCKQLYDAMESDKLDAFRLAFFVDKWDIPYVVYPNDEVNKNKLIQAGFAEVGQAGSHSVYHLMEDYSDYWLITQYGEADGSQMTFYIIQNQAGYSILVDSGVEEYEEGVRYAIKQIGNEVDAWILTHPHDDHVSAFTEIYKNPKKIKIHDVYTVDMASPEMIMEQASWDSVDAYEDFLELGVENLHYVHKGDVLDFDGLKLTVLNAYDTYVDEMSNDLLNDGSMMFKVENKEQSMLFCSDVGKAMSAYLLKEYGDYLKSDYMQMGHHGNGGLTHEFYKKVSPAVAFFDAPDWLMNDSNDKYTAVENRKFMRQSVKSAIISFNTAPNSVLLR